MKYRRASDADPSRARNECAALPSPRVYNLPSTIPCCEIIVPQLSNIPQQFFLNPTNCKSLKPLRIFLALPRLSSHLQRHTCQLQCLRRNRVSKLWFTCRSKNYTCLTEHCGTCVKYLPQPCFLSRDFHPLLCLARPMIGLGDNVISVVIISVTQVPQCPRRHASLKPQMFT